MGGDADAVRRFRARQRGTLPPIPTCSSCGRNILSSRPVCLACWLASPDGKAERAAQQRARRQRQRQAKASQ